MTTRPLAEYTVVRVVQLTDKERWWTGTDDVARPPEIGDRGTIVHVYDPNNHNTPYVVECVDQEGNTVWVADLDPEEIEPDKAS